MDTAECLESPPSCLSFVSLVELLQLALHSTCGMIELTLTLLMYELTH